MSRAITLEEILTFLLEAPMFGDLEPDELSRIVHILQVREVDDGEVLFRQGERGDAWYVLYAGAAEVTVDVKGGEAVLARLEPRSCFGEMGILEGLPRSATVRATRPSTVFRFPRARFQELLRANNLAAYKLVLEMAKVVALRQRATTRRLVELLGRDTVEPDALQEIVQTTSPTE